MSELQFPKDPIVGQEYDFAPYKYYWDDGNFTLYLRDGRIANIR